MSDCILFLFVIKMPVPPLPSQILCGQDVRAADPILQSERLLCKHFKNGYCRRGFSCSYRHMEFGVWPVALGPASEFRNHSVPVEQKNESSQVVVVDEPWSAWHIAPVRDHSVPAEQKKTRLKSWWLMSHGLLGTLLWLLLKLERALGHIALAASEAAKQTGGGNAG